MSKLLVLDNVTPALVLIIAGVGNVVARLDSSHPDVVITHGYDGEHKVGSLHKLYAAVDIRTKNLITADKEDLFLLLRAKFPAPRFDVIFEDRDTSNEHIHIEDNTAKGTSTEVKS